MSKMRWEAPPATPRAAKLYWETPSWGRALAEEAAELRAHPGEWAVIREYPYSERGNAYAYASWIRRGRIKSLQPESDWESVARVSADRKTVKVYARYTGGTTLESRLNAVGDAVKDMKR